MGLTIPAVFSDHMVVQRDIPFRVYGWYDVASTVVVTFAGESVSAVTPADDGRWEVQLSPPQSGGPYELAIAAGAEVVRIQDIYAGDVWICSGQSNMQTPLSRLQYEYPEEYRSADNPCVRICMVPEAYAFDGPRADLPGCAWLPVTPQNAGPLSAVSWFFADAMQKRTGIPQGIINSSVGGTPIQAWMSKDALAAYPELLETAQQYASTAHTAQLLSGLQQAVDDWFAALHEQDPGFRAEPAWSEGHEILRRGRKVHIPTQDPDAFAVEGCGSFWFCRTIDIDEELDVETAAPLLRLGRIVDSDMVWLNGIQVGTTGYQYPPRDYLLPAGSLKTGRNILTVRVVSGGSPVRFIPDKPYYLEAGGRRIPVDGEWRLLRGVEMEPFPEPFRITTVPTGLFNAMIAPLLHVPVCGIVWYQGESNQTDAETYHENLTAMIRDWRNKWQQEFLPWILVQLPNFGPPAVHEGPANSAAEYSSWAVVRDAQRRAQLELPRTALTVNIDLGEWNDIHPLNKIDVGRRAAAAAARLVLEDQSAPMSPVPVSWRFTEGRVEVMFLYSDGGLKTVDNGPVGQLSISDSRGGWLPAHAIIQGNTLVILVNQLPPFTIRYAWADNPAKANLCNAAGLPASPFEIHLD
ncbi:MAG: sialate O-acetylesterase [Spirochaeta sp.]